MCLLCTLCCSDALKLREGNATGRYNKLVDIASRDLLPLLCSSSVGSSVVMPQPDNICLQYYSSTGTAHALPALQVADLPEKNIPVHVSVTGTPLIMQLNRVLLPGLPRKPPAAEPLAQPLARLQPRSQTALGTSPGLLQEGPEGLAAGIALPFGQLLADTPAERSFYVFNTASMPMQLDWTFYRWVSSSMDCFETIEPMPSHRGKIAEL